MCTVPEHHLPVLRPQPRDRSSSMAVYSSTAPPSFDSLASLPPPQFDEWQMRAMFKGQSYKESATERTLKEHHQLQEERKGLDMERKGYNEEAERAHREAQELLKKGEAEKLKRSAHALHLTQPTIDPAYGQRYDTPPQPISGATNHMMDADKNLSLSYDPNLARFHIGGVQKHYSYHDLHHDINHDTSVSDDLESTASNNIEIDSIEFFDKSESRMNTVEFFANKVMEMTRQPRTEEIDADPNTHLPYDPNLVCPQCSRQYRVGEIQKFRRHCLETCPNKKE